MGYVKPRTNRQGKKRYTGCYLDLQGHLRSAGTFGDRKAAERAWQRAETHLEEGRAGDPKRGRQTLRHYVETIWLPQHVIEATTLETYTYEINRHILPRFGAMRMRDILSSHVREWIADCKEGGMSPATMQKLRFILSAIFTTALNDQIIFFHPCRGVKTPTVPVKPLVIITPEQFDIVYGALPDADIQLLVETDIETGLRWGELTELRAGDFDIPSRTLTISRAVVEVNPNFHPEGRRFRVKEYPKDEEYRRVKVSNQLTRKIQNHIAIQALGPENLLFRFPEEGQPRQRSKRAPIPADLGRTAPNTRGRTYQHGTMTAYNAAPCRCEHCRGAYAAYRAERRVKDRNDSQPQRRLVDTDGHIPRNWFRNQVWLPARKRAGIGWSFRVHGMRHAHASWLLAGGADLQVVKERLGHRRISTTERYLHTLPDQDESAIDAFEAIRYRGDKRR